MLRAIISHIRGQRGQVLVMGVGLLIMSLGAIMISVDVGWWLRDKRDAQNDADAVALAAVQEIGNPDNRAQAVAAGLDWADFNGLLPGELMPDCADGVLVSNTFCFIDRNSDGTDDMVRVKVSRPSNSFIADAFGVGSPTLNPSAAAATVYVTGACVMPWGIVGNGDIGSLYGLDETSLYVFQDEEQLKKSTGSSSGNYGAMNIYGPGADTYKDAIRGICEPENTACTNDPIVYSDETLIGCSSKPGKLGGVTDKTLDERFVSAPSAGACDAVDYAEALVRVEDTGCVERLVPIAIINDFPPSGVSVDVDVYGIINFYLAGWSKKETCFTIDAVEKCGFVWGYLISSAPVSTAQAVFTKDFVIFAPTGEALVE